MAELHRRFLVHPARTEDVSENEPIAEGVEFSSGVVAIFWLSTRTLRTYQALDELGHLIGGAATSITWLDGDLLDVVGSRFLPEGDQA